MGVCVLSRPQVEGYDIPKEEYPFEKGNSHSIDLVLKNSKFLNHRYKGDNDPLRKVDQKNRELLQEAENRIQREKSTITENLKLRIILYDREDLTTSGVKYIDLVSGKRENDIECHRQGDGSISWKYGKVGSSACKDQDILKEEYTFDEINVSKISQILNESKFLGAQDHRDFVDCNVRKEMGKAWFDQKNCKLTIELKTDDTNIPIKSIIIQAGNGEDEILSSSGNPWQVLKSSNSHKLANAGKSFLDSVTSLFKWK